MGGGAPAPDYSAANKQAQVSRDQYNYFKQIYGPVDQQFNATVMDPNQISHARSAGMALANSEAPISYGAAGRNLARYGVNPTGQQETAMNRLRNFDASRAAVGAANTSAMKAYGLRNYELQSGVATGRQQLSQANSGFSNASRLEAQRNQVNQQMAAQNASGMAQLAGTGIGLAAALMP